MKKLQRVIVMGGDSHPEDDGDWVLAEDVAELERVNNQVLHRARESEHIAMELKSDVKELESHLTPKPMETAPRDGSRITANLVVRFDGRRKLWLDESDGKYLERMLSGWLPVDQPKEKPDG